MITISLCMIVKNEEAVLAQCLDCVKSIADEIIIVDTGSTDETKKIAAKYTEAIYDFKWQDDFALARNYSFSKATKQYIMWLDADDILLVEEQQKLLRLKQTLDQNTDVVYMKYNLGMSLEDPECVFWRERLVKREKNFKWHEPIHEYIICTGKIMRADIGITHTQSHNSVKRNISIFENYMGKGNKLTNRQCFYYARELYLDHRINEAISYYNIFLQEKGGLRSNYLHACMDLAACYKIKGEENSRLKALLRYFEADVPRAEICCNLGYYYKEHEAYDKAIEWFLIAPCTRKPVDSIGAIMPRYWDYIPYMELCACYYKIGDLDQAILYNEKAATIAPDDKKILHNRCFLATEREKLQSK